MYAVVTNNVQISVLRTSKICGFSLLFCFFSWRITALQGGLCHTSTWISHIYIYIYICICICICICIFSLEPLPAPTIPPLQVVTGRQPRSLCYTAASRQLICFTHEECIYMCVNATFSISPSLSFPHCVRKSILFVCISISSLWIGSSVLFS